MKWPIRFFAAAGGILMGISIFNVFGIEWGMLLLAGIACGLMAALLEMTEE